MSLDSDGPAQESAPSNESWTELYDRTCGDTAPADRKGGRGKRSRSPDFIPEKRMEQVALRPPFVDNKEVIKAHCTHHSAAVDGTQEIAGLESAITARAAAQCERPLGQGLSAAAANRFSKGVRDAKKRELDAWCKFQVSSPVLWKNVAKDIVDTRWVLTWKSAEGRRTAKARLVARGFQDPDLAAGLVDTSSCVSLRSSPLQVISPSFFKKMEAVELGHQERLLAGGSLSTRSLSPCTTGVVSEESESRVETECSGLWSE